MKIEGLDFVPPKVEQYVWATYVSLRSPQFKIHRKEAHANAALSNHWPTSDVVKYKLEDSGWVPYEYYLVPKECAWCSGPLLNRWGHHSSSAPMKQRKKRVLDQERICESCHRQDYIDYIEEQRVAREKKQLAELKEKYEQA